jgi:dienelactone hydrolase
VTNRGRFFRRWIGPSTALIASVAAPWHRDTVAPLHSATVAPSHAATLAPWHVALVPQRVTLHTDDGVTLAATWYEPSARPAPAVVLVHMLQKSRRDWDQLATRMAGDGIAVLALDLRGHGESQGNAQDHAGMVQDVRTARRFAASRPDVTPAKIGIAGASFGATLAALAAADDATVAALALLSPTVEYRGMRIDGALRKYGSRPLLLVASDDDGYAMRTVKELQKGGAARELVMLTHAGNGTSMLAADPDLGRRVVEWFRRTLL